VNKVIHQPYAYVRTIMSAAISTSEIAELSSKETLQLCENVAALNGWTLDEYVNELEVEISRHIKQ
jgi:hypothetical protein